MKVLMYTKVYNGEKTLARTIESVLNQTYTNFDYYILDNGSTDNTRAIIEAYRAIDQRIKVISNETNNIHALLDFDKLMRTIPTPRLYEYFALVDADDTYHPDFLEKTINYSLLYDLDICAVGSVFINSYTGQEMDKRKLNYNIRMETPQEWDMLFPYFYQFVMPVWAKLFKMDTVILQMTYEKGVKEKIINGVDTYFCIRALLACQRFGVLSDICHTYYVGAGSAYHTYYPNRVYGYHLINEGVKEFLIQKVGEVSEINRIHMYSTLINNVAAVLFAVRNEPLEIKIENYNQLMEIEDVKTVRTRVFKGAQDKYIQNLVNQMMEGIENEM